MKVEQITRITLDQTGVSLAIQDSLKLRPFGTPARYDPDLHQTPNVKFETVPVTETRSEIMAVVEIQPHHPDTLRRIDERKQQKKRQEKPTEIEELLAAAKAAEEYLKFNAKPNCEPFPLERLSAAIARMEPVKRQASFGTKC